MNNIFPKASPPAMRDFYKHLGLKCELKKNTAFSFDKLDSHFKWKVWSLVGMNKL